MVKLMNSKLAIKMLIAGVVVVVVSYAVVILDAINVYSKIPECTRHSGSCSFSINDIVNDLASIALILGLLIVVAGVLLIMASYLQRRRK